MGVCLCTGSQKFYIMKSTLKKILIVLMATLCLGYLVYYGFIFLVAGYNPFLMGKERSKEEIIAYALKNHIPTDEIYMIDSASLRTRGAGQFPKMYLYDHNGLQLKFHSCFELLKGFEDTLKNNKHYFTLDTTSHLQEELMHFRHSDGSSVDSHLSHQNYYLIYYYPMWMPGLNRRKLFPLRDRLAKEPAFKLYLVNCDKRTEWHMKKKKQHTLF